MDLLAEEGGSDGFAGIGVFLKREREKKGITHAQLFEMTKLRADVLKALEEEDWRSLPAPVFVKGFIRSYCHCLGLDEGEAMALYRKSAPVSMGPPEPVTRPAKGPKRLSVILLLVLAFTLLSYGFWKYYPSPDTRLKTQNPSEELMDLPKERVDLKEPSEGGAATSAEEIQVRGPSSGRTDIGALPKTTPPLEEVSHREESAGVPASGAFGPVESNPEVETSGHTLKAKVRESTWLKIFIDNAPPKEYLLRPGSQQVWKAGEGFEIVIGNAGGLDLEYDGKKVEPLGGSGKVVRLRLPKDYQKRSVEN